MLFQNRKKVGVSGNIVPLPLVALVVIAPALSLSYLWMGARCESLGKELKALEAEVDELHRKCTCEESRWMRMKSPGEIEKALRRHRIEMSWPSERQIVRVTGSDMQEALAQGSRESHPRYAQMKTKRVGVND